MQPLWAPEDLICGLKDGEQQTFWWRGGEGASSPHKGQQGNMLNVFRGWQGLAEAGVVVGGAAAREETTQRGREHPSWEVTGLPRCSMVSNWVLTTPSRFRFHSWVHSPPGCFLLDMAANSHWFSAPSPVSTPVYTSLLDQISAPTAFRLTGLRAVALGPCMVIYILLPWMGGWYPGWYLHACYKPHPGLYISHPSDLLLVPGQVFLVGKFSALPDLCGALPCHPVF